MNLTTLLDTHFVKTLAQEVCGDERMIVERTAMFMVKAPEEDERNINRLLIFPPKGYASNQPNLTNCFQGVERATIEIKGAVRDGKRSFSKVDNCLLVPSYHEISRISDLDKPYLNFDIDNPDPNLTLETHSSHKPGFHIVRPDGTGFYHTLINLKDDWLVLQLKKILRPQKAPNMQKHYRIMQDQHIMVLNSFYDGIIQYGDKLFSENPDLIQTVAKMPHQISLPALGEMLYIRDTGKHETCTAFAMILKISKTRATHVLDYLQSADIPPFFAEQLIKKIKKKQERQAISHLERQAISHLEQQDLSTNSDAAQR